MKSLERRWRIPAATLLMLWNPICPVPTVIAFSSPREISAIGVPSRVFDKALANSSPNLQMAVPKSTSVAQDVDDSETGTSSKATIAAGLVTGVTTLAIAAKMGIVPGPFDPVSGDYGIYTDAMILRDIGSTVIATILAVVAVKGIGLGYERGYYSSKVSRKLQHTLLAPAFIVTFPAFSSADGARYFALIVTVLNAVRLYLAATGEGESSLARSVSRSGDKSEALGGPFIYVCLLSLFILVFWRTSMIGIVAASTMAAGDGMADLIGRRFGKTNKWWFSNDKSVAGTVAFAISASFVSYGLVNWLQYTGCLEIGFSSTDLALRIVGISILSSIVELLPIGDDNFTVPLAAMAMAALFLQ